jgi:hypothetical protein
MLSFMAPKKVSGFPFLSLVLHVCSYHCVCEMKVRCSLVSWCFMVKSSSSFCTALLFATKSKFCVEMEETCDLAVPLDVESSGFRVDWL